MQPHDIYADDENFADDQPFDGNESIAQAGDTASAEATAAELRAFQEKNLDPEPKSDLQRWQEKVNGQTPPALAPPTQPEAAIPLSALDQLTEKFAKIVSENRAPAPAPAPEPPPQQSLVALFDAAVKDPRNDSFYREAMERAGYRPNDKGEFTLEATNEVRNRLAFHEREQAMEQRFAQLEAQRAQEQTLAIAENLDARLSNFEPLSEFQQNLLGQAVGAFLQKGARPAQAIEAALKEFAPMLKAKSPAPPVVRAQPRGPQPQQQRRPVTNADRIVATPGMRPAAAQPQETPDQRLERARRGFAERFTGARRG